MSDLPQDSASPAVVAEGLRALADVLPLDQGATDLLTRAAELVELVDSQAVDLARLRLIEARARDFLERPQGASQVALETARYIGTGEADV